MLKPGMFISDRYEVIDKVGSGGMADVYKARDQRLNRFVAIKVLKPEYSSDKSFVNKFRGEAQSAAGLSHPNIVNVYDVGDDGVLHFIVMELVEGITLKRFIEKKGKLEIKEAVGITIQIAQGMEAAHDNHIIHRDIKPQNIIISRDGKVKVTDFGIAKATTSNTITSNAMGSVHYLSPEQARGGYSDEKSDIYSLGVTLYEMLSGKVPFAGDNTVSVALLHIQGEAMPLRDLDPDIPLSIDKIVQRCMQKKPERRYHTASELIADLKKAITNPDEDFVKIPAFVASDSPTINISDDLGKIKSGTFHEEDTLRTTKNLTPGNFSEEDDEELDTVDSKVEKVFLIGTIAVTVVLGIVVIAVVAWILTNLRGSSEEGATPTPVITIAPTEEPTPTPTQTTGETYKVPKVVGLTREDAKSTLEALDPNVFIDWDEDYSDTYDEGYVIKQYPESGNDRVKGGTVVLTLSTGKESFGVPNVYGLTESQAESKLKEKGLNMSSEYSYNNDIESGKVIKTEPARDELVTSGDTIKVYVSRGPENTKVSVPDLLGMTQAEAKTSLEALGLKLGTVSYETSSVYAEGQISYQNYSTGESVSKGTEIDITISKGMGEVTYRGQLTIDVNPLETYEEGEAAFIILEMEQGDEPAYTIFEENLTKNEFPFTIPVEGESTEPGTVKMYVDGELYMMPGESNEATWTVNFKAVEE